MLWYARPSMRNPRPWETISSGLKPFCSLLLTIESPSSSNVVPPLWQHSGNAAHFNIANATHSDYFKFTILLFSFLLFFPKKIYSRFPPSISVCCLPVISHVLTRILVAHCWGDLRRWNISAFLSFGVTCVNYDF